MNITFTVIGLSALALLSLPGCSGNKASKTDDAVATDTIKEVSTFNADTAFSYVSRQVAFGPRIPGSEGSRLCQNFIVGNLLRDGAKVTEQKGVVTAYTGEKLPINNIMGSYNTACDYRILLLAHYDTRPWADNESDPENARKPIPGANDGGSGVAVLLEIARQLGQTPPPEGVGVDLLFVDAEDYGMSARFSNNDETWCLGTQYWTANMPYTKANTPRYCIVLDMVGGLNAKFYREFLSNKMAPGLIDKVWAIAAKSGYADRFINKDGGSIVDDHVYINQAGIPAIDIIESHNDITHSFPPTWHTLNDNMGNIDRTALKAVGQTVLNLIHEEKPNK